MKVLNKQPNSAFCIVCGLRNSLGLKAAFYETDDNQVVSLFTPHHEHQGYPGRLHGGIAGSILDETIGRAIMITDKEVWGVTLELAVQFKKPVPLDVELRVVGRITSMGERIFEGTGEIRLPDGEIAVMGQGKYMKLPLSKITSVDFEAEQWEVFPSENDPAEIEL